MKRLLKSISPLIAARVSANFWIGGRRRVSDGAAVLVGIQWCRISAAARSQMSVVSDTVGAPLALPAEDVAPMPLLDTITDLV